MAKRRCWTRKNRKNSRKNRKNRNTRARRMYYGGQAPVDWSNPGPMKLNLAQGTQFLGFHPGFRSQSGGFVAPYPGGVTESVSPMTADPSSRVAPLTAAFNEIAGLKDQAGGSGATHGGRRRGRKSGRKSRKGKGRKGRKGSRKQRGGDFVRWGGARGGGGCGLMRGGSAVNLAPTEVSASGEMLLPQDYANKAASLNPEWNLAKDPMAFAPKA